MPEPPPFATTPEHGRPNTTTPPSRHRHGKSGASDSAHSSAPQPRLTRLAVLPAAFMAGISTAVTGTVLRLQEGTADAATWGVLAGGAVLGCGCIAGAVMAARNRARSDAKRAESLRQAITTGNWALDEDLTRLKRGEQLLSRGFAYQAARAEDPYQKLEYEVTEAQHRAREALVWAASYFQSASDDNSDKVEVFVNLARRLQSLVHREISILDELENEVEDPDLLKGLFHVDHLATRIRRHAENLAVLGGAVSRRQWTNPVTMTEVLRSAIAEVEQYSAGQAGAADRRHPARPRRRRRHPPARRTRRERHGVLRPAHPGPAARPPRHRRARRRGRGPRPRHARRASRTG